jgi:hypothetical protein
MTKPHKRITNREFKLLIKPQGLDRLNRITELSEQIHLFCIKKKIGFFHLDNANTALRNIYFYDTANEHFRQNNLILRVRESRQKIWVDDWCEVTLKHRSHEIKDAIAIDPSPKKGLKCRLRLKEEILRGDKLGSTRILYSNNAVLDAVPLDSIFDRSFASISRFFPKLKIESLEKKTPVRIVGGSTNKILEACLPLGNLIFGDGVEAHCEIAIWMRSVGDPIVGELAFAYRVTDENRAQVKAHKRADAFFSALQFELEKWLEIGSTKTALVYGKPE